MKILKKWWFWVVVVIILILVIIQNLFLTYVHNQLDKANYCDVKDDCIEIVSQCGFGFDILVNKNEEQNIKSMLKLYKVVSKSCDSVSFHDAMLRFKEKNCVNNKCVMIYTPYAQFQ